MASHLLLISVFKMGSTYIFTKMHFFVLLTSLLLISTPSCIANSGDQSDASDDVLDPFSPDGTCRYYEGVYSKEYEASLLCCANNTLRLPKELFSNKESYRECSKQFKDDLTSDLPTGMWKAFLCELKKLSVFKSNKVNFDEFMNTITKLYPSQIKTDVMAQSSKCKAISSEQIEDHLKIQKIMECYNGAEYKVCHKPYGDAEDDSEVVATMKRLGCPMVYGFEEPAEYCCKGRSTPYPITEFPAMDQSQREFDAAEHCQASFEKLEEELMPETFNVGTPATDDDGEDYQMHTTWDVLCASACMMEQRNYTQDMLKLDFERVAEYFTKNFPNKVKTEISKILRGRKNKRIFLAMDVDTENSEAMTFQELSEKFKMASKKDKIQYYCKFVSTIEFEERRALHEYCFDENYGKEWGNDHHLFFVGW